MPGTVKLHRVFKCRPERIYKAFIDADAMAKWLPPNGFTGKVHEIDARVGGSYRMSFTNFSTGSSHAFGGEFLEMIETSGCDIRTNSKPQTCPARWKRRSI